MLALSSLSSPSHGERALKPGDEVITVAAGFPTTINPMIQFGCIPVFVDVDIPSYNIKVEDIESNERIAQLQNRNKVANM